MTKITKSYKPEILSCPYCNSRLKYCYTVSSKNIYFSSGRNFIVKNLGYKCPVCNDEVYFSQTATKFAPKGCMYSMKLVFMIYFYRSIGYSREKVCYDLEEKGIKISERTIDILYNKFKDLIQRDYEELKKAAYKRMLEKYQAVNLSIDQISLNKKRLIIIRDYYTAEILGAKIFYPQEEAKIELYLANYLTKNLNFGIIATIRKEDFLHPLMKKMVKSETKFISYLKI